MKILMKNSGIFLACMVLVFFTGCGDGDSGNTTPSLEEVQSKALSKTWKLKTVTQDGKAPEEKYDNFSLTINGTAKSYTATNGPAEYSTWPK